jgi:hypothetical protein
VSGGVLQFLPVFVFLGPPPPPQVELCLPSVQPNPSRGESGDEGQRQLRDIYKAESLFAARNVFEPF